MGVVADHDVRTTIYGEMSFRPVFGRRFPLVWDTPVKRDDNPIYPVSKAANVGFERLP
jgi:hypothetical protein